MSNELYREQILDHYHHPRHFGHLKEKDEKVSGANLSCGDEINIEVKYNDSLIEDIAFSGSSCAICTAAASMLCEELIGESTTKINQLQSSDVRKMLGVELSPVRLKCALLPLQTLKSLKRVGESR